jgi:hypothetical protein
MVNASCLASSLNTDVLPLFQLALEQSPAARPVDCLRTRQSPADCRTCGTVLVTIGHTPLRLPGSGCVPGQGRLDSTPLVAKRMNQIINSDEAGPART